MRFYIIMLRFAGYIMQNAKFSNPETWFEIIVLWFMVLTIMKT